MALPALKDDDHHREEIGPEDEPCGAVLRPVELADGRVEVRVLPLTLELLLHPREGDKVTQSDFHSSFLGSLVDRLRRWLERRPGVAVFTDLLFLWDKPGLPDPGPDVAVVFGLEEDRKTVSRKVGGRFDVARWGRRPSLVIEVVSPEHGRLRKKDLEINLVNYAAAGVEEYLIVDPVRLDSEEPLRLTGYRLSGAGRYAAIAPDAEGRILSRTAGLLFRSDPEDRDVQVYVAKTGRRLLTSDEEEERAEVEAAARRDAEERARAAEAELARLRAKLGRDDL